MKIPKPTEPEAPPFKRKRSPPPQATKLLVASLGAGLVFMALLAIVFVPRYLENLNPPPSTLLKLQLDTNGSTPRIVVTFALYDFAMARFNASLSRDNATVGSLPAGLVGGSGGLTFSDTNGDGQLDAGDTFGFTASIQGAYRFRVWQVDLGYIVGSLSFTGTPAAG